MNQFIKKITIINENQQLFENGTQTYNVWLTRGVIFDLGIEKSHLKRISALSQKKLKFLEVMI